MRKVVYHAVQRVVHHVVGVVHHEARGEEGDNEPMAHRAMSLQRALRLPTSQASAGGLRALRATKSIFFRTRAIGRGSLKRGLSVLTF